MDSDGEIDLDLVEQIEREENIDGEDNEEPMEVQAEEVDETETNKTTEESKTTKPKKIIRNPQPKLNVETLKGPKGLTALPELFKKQSFKGKGYESRDLDVLLKTYEYWCHRMFPKYPFDQCIEKLESLGNKKPVITFIKKIRMGLLDEPEPERPNESDNEEPEPFVENIEESTTAETQFDTLISNREKEEVAELTEEQKERIRLNREKALKIRQERLKKIQIQANSKLEPSMHLSNVSQSNEERESFINIPEEQDRSEVVELTAESINLNEDSKAYNTLGAVEEENTCLSQESEEVEEEMNEIPLEDVLTELEK